MVEDGGDVSVEWFACCLGLVEDLVFEPAGDADVEVGWFVRVVVLGLYRHRGG